MKIIINGRFKVRNLTGQERFAEEMVSVLDRLSNSNEFELVVPKYCDKQFKYKNIKVIKYGNLKRELWEQVDLYRYARKSKSTILNLTTTCSLINPGIVVIHDICQEIHPEWYKTTYGKLSTLWHHVIIKSCDRRAKQIFTVSEFSKKEILSRYSFKQRKICVLGNGWEHITKINPDESILTRLNIYNKAFYLTVGSITPQKNYEWIISNASRNPNAEYVIVGDSTKLSSLYIESKKIIYAGRVSDSELKALMMNCKAFVLPSFHEGFGIPPLEALACGSKLILSNAGALPEVFGKTATYINPYDSDIDISIASKYEQLDSNQVLTKYTWENFGQILLTEIRKI